MCYVANGESIVQEYSILLMEIFDSRLLKKKGCARSMKQQEGFYLLSKNLRHMIQMSLHQEQLSWTVWRLLFVIIFISVLIMIQGGKTLKYEHALIYNWYVSLKYMLTVFSIKNWVILDIRLFSLMPILQVKVSIRSCHISVCKGIFLASIQTYVIVCMDW